MCIAGGTGSFWEHFGEQRVEVQRAGRNVTTSQHRDIGSTKIEVNKKQRRDVRAISASPSLKAKRDHNSRASRYVRTRARKAEQQQKKSVEKTITFVFFFFLERMIMFYRLNTCVLTFSIF